MRQIKRPRRQARRQYIAGIKAQGLYVYRYKQPTREDGFFYLRRRTARGYRSFKLRYLGYGAVTSASPSLRAAAFLSAHVRRWEARERARARWWTFTYRYGRLEIDLGTEKLFFPLDVPVAVKAGNDWWDEDLALMAEYSEELAAFLQDPEEYLVGRWARRLALAAQQRRALRNRRREAREASLPPNDGDFEIHLC